MLKKYWSQLLIILFSFIWKRSLTYIDPVTSVEYTMKVLKVKGWRCALTEDNYGKRMTIIFELWFDKYLDKWDEQRRLKKVEHGWYICPDCKGSGHYSGLHRYYGGRCQLCEGRGIIDWITMLRAPREED